MTFKRTNTAPVTILFLMLPYGISLGFVSVTLPFLLTNHGFTVSTAAFIVAFGISANMYTFVFGPFADLTLNLHKWYLIGVGVCSSFLLLLSLIALDPMATGILTAIVFISQVAATFVVLPVGGFMAHTVAEEKKGRAGGWYQAGNLGGMGLGGGAGLWLSNHFSYHVAGVILSLAMIAFASALYFVPQVCPVKNKTLKQGFKTIALDIRDTFRLPIAIFTFFLVLTPIGVGGAAFVWSSIATDWHVKADTVALVTGTLSGVVSATGCVCGGWIADKLGRWWAFFGSGTLMAIVTLMMTISAYRPASYVTGILFYAFAIGLCYAAFSAIVLHAIGRGLASTKYALFTSVGSVAPVYMVAFDGWIHDSYSTTMMLRGETVLSIGFIIISLITLSQLKLKKITKANLSP